ncbi:MAG: hypothetical protein ACOYEC_05760 [Christensenellales bacterium]|jgi:hypothetical protein|nr:hypothetical protein [Clostridiales bacterium]
MAEDAIQEFQNLIQRLASANLLVLDKEISHFLSALVSKEEFKDIITTCSKNYNFEEDWNKIKNKEQFILPHNKRQRVAFIIGLFYKFDINELSIINILTNFYGYNQDLQTAYKQFTDEVTKPLQEAFISLLKGEPVEGEAVDKPLPVLDKMIEDINEWMNLLASSVTNLEKELPEYAIKEIHFMIEGFTEWLDKKDINALKLIWLGLKNTLIKYNLDCKEISQTEMLFKLYGLDMEIK